MVSDQPWDEFRLAFEKCGLERMALSGRTAVVTGGGRGIGRWSAIALAWCGARVVIAEISPDGQAVVAEILEAGGEALYFPCDVSTERSVGELVEAVHARYGPLDILVNNAILCPAVSVMDMPVKQWDQIMAVNLRGTFLTCKAFLPDLLSKGQGVIVNMTSTDAMPGLSAYIASKQGITGFTQSLAAEIGQQGVRVVAFAPGLVDTPGIRGVAPGLVRRLGMTEEQFLGVSFHPAYTGMMPPTHAGLATAYLTAVLADEFHGEVVTGYTVLERAGVIAAPQAITPSPAEIKPGPAAGKRELVDLARSLQEMLTATEAEFNHLPVFVRPMARGGLKSRSGQSLADWQRSAARFEGLMMTPNSEHNQADLQMETSRLKDLLPKLVDYFAGVPGETARFTKDQEMLKEVSRIAEMRVATLKELIEGLG